MLRWTAAPSSLDVTGRGTRGVRVALDLDIDWAHQSIVAVGVGNDCRDRSVRGFRQTCQDSREDLRFARRKWASVEVFEGNMRAWSFVWFVLAAGTCVAPSAVADSKPGDRIALLIGNAQYPDSDTPLTTPVQDVRAVGAALQRRGYAVDLAENVGKRAMQDALSNFFGKIKSGSDVLIYFSGYGIQSNDKNYMVPIDGQIWSEADLRRDGVTVDSVMTEIDRRGADAKVVILDAANRNPFERRFRGYSTGLVAVNDPPANTLMMYSTAPKTMLRQGSGTRSVFADELVGSIGGDGISRAAFDKVRAGVSAATQGAQVPWIVSTLKESSGGWTDPRPVPSKPPRNPVEAGRPPEPPKPVEPTRQETAKQEVTKQEILKQEAAKPETVRQDSAKLEPPKPTTGPAADPAGDFAAAKRANTRQAYQDFVARHPTGAWSERARAEIDRIDAAVKPAAVDIQVLTYSREDLRMKAELDRAIERNPGDAGALYRRGQLHAIHREFQLALADFDEVIRLNPQDVEALNNRCWVRAMVEELDRALRDCNEALKLRPNFADALDSRGLVNLKIGMAGMAVRDYDAALRGNGKQASSLYGRGLARLRSGDTQEGNSDISDALAMDPGIAKEFARYGIR
ncbi:caspase family protein [Methylobacterium aquaticum]|uniref:caspase family protein n=1 Tax=Methylobacterium aquaticum TaxID=270351 RepID=UPI003D178F89